jgi:hypothetical protein
LNGYDVVMAKQTKVTMIDDLDGESEAVETVCFGLDNISYEIDVSDEHADELHTVLQHYAQAGRRTSGGRRATSARPRSQPAAKTSVPTPDDIRAWAGENGLKISARGRISTKVLAAYEAAH